MDGHPLASAIWYDVTPDGLIRINTGANSRKARLIEKAGAVTLTVQREEPPYQYVVVEGTVVDKTLPAPLEVSEAIAIRYLGEDDGRAFARRDERHDERALHRPARPVADGGLLRRAIGLSSRR